MDTGAEHGCSVGIACSPYPSHRALLTQSKWLPCAARRHPGAAAHAPVLSAVQRAGTKDTLYASAAAGALARAAEAQPSACAALTVAAAPAATDESMHCTAAMAIDTICLHAHRHTSPVSHSRDRTCSERRCT